MLKRDEYYGDGSDVMVEICIRHSHQLALAICKVDKLYAIVMAVPDEIIRSVRHRMIDNHA